MACRYKARSATPGAYNFVAGSLGFAPAVGDVKTTAHIGDGTAGTLNLSIYTLKSGVVTAGAVLEGYYNYPQGEGGAAGKYHEVAAAEAKDGTWFGNESGVQGTYSPGGTYLEGAAAQLAIDVAEVEENAGGMIEDCTILSVGGIYHEATVAEVQSGVHFGPDSAFSGTFTHTTDYVLKTDVVATAYIIEGHKQWPATGGDGTYHETTTGEVQSGVHFGAGSVLVGTLEVGGYTYGDNSAAKVLTTAAAAGTYQAVATTDVRKDVAVGVSPAVGSAYIPAAGDVRKTVNVDATTGSLVGVVDSDGTLHTYGTCSSTQAWAAAGIIHDSGTAASNGTLKSDGTYNATGILSDATHYYATGWYNGTDAPTAYTLYTLKTDVVATAYIIEGHKQWPATGGDGTYHETTTGEVQSGVHFGAGSVLVGTLEGGEGGGVTMPDPASPILTSALDAIRTMLSALASVQTFLGVSTAAAALERIHRDPLEGPETVEDEAAWWQALRPFIVVCADHGSGRVAGRSAMGFGSGKAAISLQQNYPADQTAAAAERDWRTTADQVLSDLMNLQDLLLLQAGTIEDVGDAAPTENAALGEFQVARLAIEWGWET